ncbi:CDP-diacylglycerol--glycerol-3-phosphate 3-phosphatidyltransferase, mitochondrial-like isoform X2 [Mizuhopecten yessoensis]|uniref:CDP-diacylglycerol--glycerol-3-phosphate 3-phosphatidyltransferase, mitochondrial-like isoform X2 n=1 Tax=Mizuhopecten yessoensis TaxID=6573 RepID=UPI000B4577CE|nr:CDP-diacylglycerol--glycerol-3-phosphate 3-phosphatidyltransferase, mitochondrial-like isoform X2 [Mizuhopecten yessoensis]
MALGGFSRLFRSCGQKVIGFMGMFGSLRYLSQTNCMRDIQRQISDVEDLNITTNDQVKHAFSWIGNKAPCFGINGHQVQVLQQPDQFYETLKVRVKQAKKRVVLASLYLGTGVLEQELVDNIREACIEAKKNKDEDFEVHVLLDFVRGSRGHDSSSRTMLTPLLKEFEGMIHVHLFHSPNLRGLVRSLLPQRFDEIVGLHHMKMYLFDDSFIISGANLSESYFTDRQDRYILFNECVEMADFFSALVKGVAACSFVLHSDNTVTLSPYCKAHPFDDKDDGVEYKKEARQRILDIVRNKRNEGQLTRDGVDTWVYPLVQMGPLGIQDDEQVMKHMLRKAKKEEKLLLASGYFNLTEDYMQIILQETDAQFDILMSSPETNGFFGAKGVSGAVPFLYVQTAKEFYNRICQGDQEARIQLQEYFHETWSFHVKGLWYYFSDSKGPAMTIIGSSNFGHRSVYRDLECQAVVVTNNTSLQNQLKKEHEDLYQRSSPMTEDTFKQLNRYVPFYNFFICNT